MQKCTPRSVQHSPTLWLSFKAAGVITYDVDWPYFVSSRETALEMSILCKLDAEILIGQMSYKQRADIYNYIHGYEEGVTAAASQTHGDSSYTACKVL